MPRRPSADLFHTVKSLSRSEWFMLLQIFTESLYNPQKKNDAPSDVERFILHLRNANRYDESEIKELFELGDSPKEITKFKNLKRSAKEIVYKAIERAPENQTPGNILQRLPIILSHLVKRGIFEDSELLIRRYLDVARKHEYFEIEKRLLDFWSHIQSQRLEESAGTNVVAKSILRRVEISQILMECDKLTEIKNLLRLALKASHSERQAKAQHFLSDAILANTHLMSTRAKVLRLEILRQLYLIYGKSDEFFSAQAEILSLFNQFPEHFESPEMVYTLMLSYYAQIELDIRSHRFDKASQSLVDFSRFTQVQTGDNREIGEELVLLCEMTFQRVEINKEGMKQSMRKLEQWYSTKPHFRNRKKFPLSAFLIAEVAHLLGEFSKAIKYLNMILIKGNSSYRMDLSLAASALILINRIELNDLEGIQYEIKNAKKMQKKFGVQNSFFEAILDMADRYSNANGNGKAAFIDFIEKMNSSNISSDNNRLMKHFDFKIWAKCKVLQIPLISSLKVQEFPRSEL